MPRYNEEDASISEETSSRHQRSPPQVLPSDVVDADSFQHSVLSSPDRDIPGGSPPRTLNGHRAKKLDFTVRYARHMEFASILLFVLGSILYLVCSIHDYEWSQTLLDLPEWLRYADDDESWIKYRMEERYGYVLEKRRMGGIRRRLMSRQFWGVEAVDSDRFINKITRKTPYIELRTQYIRELKEQTPEELYYGLDWAELSQDIKDAYSILGYNKNAWDNGIEVDTDNASWADLTPEQQEAALFIGYTEMIWCEIDDNEISAPTYAPSSPPTQSPIAPTTSPSVQPTVSKSLSSTSSTVPSLDSTSSLQPTKTVAPSSLPSFSSSLHPSISIRPTVSISPSTSPIITNSPTMKFWLLGVPSPSVGPSIMPSNTPSAVKSTSPSTQPSPSPSFSLSPSDFPSTENSFNPSDTPSISIRPSIGEILALQPNNVYIATQEELYEDEWWRDLPPDIQDAYTLLGWNETLWDTGNSPPSENANWNELTLEMQDAATHIGFTQQTWDGDNDETLIPSSNLTTNHASSFDTDKECYEDYYWIELPQEVKQAAITLGFNEYLWDNNGTTWSDELEWHELPTEAQEAAGILGYDEASWNASGDVELQALLDAAGGQYVSQDDDYVWEVGPAGIPVSEYQILYFFAAFCFLGLGLLDLTREKAPFHLLMVLAGVFGVASAIFIEENIHLSNILDCFSVHLFLLEGVAVLVQSMRRDLSGEADWYKRLIIFADMEFITGAFLDVVLSYFYLFDDTADWDTGLAVAWVFSTVLWLHCSLIYLCIFLYDIFETDDNEDNEMEKNAKRLSDGFVHYNPKNSSSDSSA